MSTAWEQEQQAEEKDLKILRKYRQNNSPHGDTAKKLNFQLEEYTPPDKKKSFCST